jgi:hypothetical protein
MKAKERDQNSDPAGNARLGSSGSAAVNAQQVIRGAHPGDAIARAKALARWENEGGRVVSAARELPGRS